ncbi:response regulator [Dyadobacter chenwenxiniae]|uniref:Response regulator n=1 Tax=Dyadobacter chenwenxiniae TaxID=2906456 RepID=A0A9X1PH88_9BACT|nr:response regulator [Dyadobacter chenwenxiniae]MCF0052889.1 response regulator [Dyadobacter chenwenxiniae]MCF0060200.1 response regulator [Dyadobacter chenwenxiniae]UON85937.1 response regulator [Dyadobacter chenwenxiniae]
MSILYIDHEVNNLNSFKASFRRDATIYLADSTDEGLKVLEEKQIDVIFVDQQMPDMTGLEFLKIASKQYPESTRVLLTGQAYSAEFKHAEVKGYMHNFITKPWDEQDLRRLITTNLI